MKMYHLLVSAAVTLLFSEASVSALTTVKFIGDLRSISFGRQFPRNGLQLLYRFVDHAEVEHSHVISPVHPTNGEYGYKPCHVENPLLPTLTDPDVNVYYTLGGVEDSTSRGMPGDRKRDGIMVRVVKEEGSDQFWFIDEVYLTELKDNQTCSFDPQHTFKVQFSLLREIKQLQTSNPNPLAGLEEFLKEAQYVPAENDPSEEFQSANVLLRGLRSVNVPRSNTCRAKEIGTENSVYSIKLELFSEKGKASARLYIKKTLTQWRDLFSKSWVRFYMGNSAGDEYFLENGWKRVPRFTQETTFCDSEYDTYIYRSNIQLSYRIQARFFISDYNELIRTDTWNSCE